METGGAVVLVFDLEVLAVDNLFKLLPIVFAVFVDRTSVLERKLSGLGVSIKAEGSRGANERLRLQETAGDIFAVVWVQANLADLGESAGSAASASSSRTGRLRHGLTFYHIQNKRRFPCKTHGCRSEIHA